MREYAFEIFILRSLQNDEHFKYYILLIAEQKICMYTRELYKVLVRNLAYRPSRHLATCRYCLDYFLIIQ